MVLVNTLSCAQPGKACGQQEGVELAAPTAGQKYGRADGRAGGQTGGQAALHSQAKAQNGAAAPVTMETELNNEQPEMQHGCLALWPHSHQALTPTHGSSYTHTHVCVLAWMCTCPHMHTELQEGEGNGEKR